jgi:hypothetical protein
LLTMPLPVAAPLPPAGFAAVSEELPARGDPSGSDASRASDFHSMTSATDGNRTFLELRDFALRAMSLAELRTRCRVSDSVTTASSLAVGTRARSVNVALVARRCRATAACSALARAGVMTGGTNSCASDDTGHACRARNASAITDVPSIVNVAGDQSDAAAGVTISLVPCGSVSLVTTTFIETGRVRSARSRSAERTPKDSKEADDMDASETACSGTEAYTGPRAWDAWLYPLEDAAMLALLAVRPAALANGSAAGKGVFVRDSCRL